MLLRLNKRKIFFTARKEKSDSIWNLISIQFAFQMLMYIRAFLISAKSIKYLRKKWNTVNKASVLSHIYRTMSKWVKSTRKITLPNGIHTLTLSILFHFRHSASSICANLAVCILFSVYSLFLPFTWRNTSATIALCALKINSHIYTHNTQTHLAKSE